MEVSAPNTIFRAITFQAQDDGSTVALSVDIPAGQCESYLMLVQIALPAGESVDFQSEWLDGEIRVDTRQLRSMRFQIDAERGKSTINLTVGGLASGVFRDLLEGSTLRLKLPLPQPVYLHFSLHGSAAALARAESLCRGWTSADERFFEKSAPKDEAFF
jgi:hypothetical protein